MKEEGIGRLVDGEKETKRRRDEETKRLSDWEIG